MKSQEALTALQEGKRVTHKNMGGEYFQLGDVPNLLYDNNGFVVAPVDKVLGKHKTGWSVFVPAGSVEYRFQNLLEIHGNNLTGPMGPLSAVSSAGKSYGHAVHGLCRVFNPNSTSGYDHLIVVQRRKSESDYIMYVDMGIKLLPVGIGHMADPEITITPIYLDEITEEAQAKHRKNCEIKNKKDFPIMPVGEPELREIFRQAEEGNYLTPIRKE